MEVRGGAMEGKRSIVDRYMAILERRPLYTKMATNYLICFLGDVSCQAMGAGSLRALSRAFDVKRAVLYGSMGALYLAPLAHYWYGALDSAIVKTPAGQVDGAEKPSTATRVTGALKMLFIDQAIASPIVNSGFLFAYAAFTGLAGGSGFGAALHSGSAKVQSALWPTLVASWKIWPAANFLNFMFVPLQLRALFLSVVGVAWNLVLSSIAN
ncbi:hypothetical protein JKP88DRAFT_82606 [Tribonema minus]|uniref:Uncharacterized protein n=1 Tax=Tribonema minus TaxID=303371 RepID=A0A835YM13_9STRA|nr:hypothetical protein JKP88DRAFT_82606 [Tribonema minus]